MVYLHQYDWIMAVGTIFATLDAYCIGANDVANSYATSVASRSLTLKQACLLACVTEFLGALLLGSTVTSTIKDGIIDASIFAENPGALMLAFATAICGSSLWMLLATRAGMPVSTTHSIIGALAGVGIASRAKVSWAWEKGSISQIAASWLIAPALAGAISAILFTLIKYSVLARKNALKAGLIFSPIFFALTGAMLSLFIVVKGAPNLKADKLSGGQQVGIVAGVAVSLLAICLLFFLPYFHRRLVKRDADLRWWHVFHGPTMWTWPEPARQCSEDGVVQNYYEHQRTDDSHEFDPKAKLVQPTYSQTEQNDALPSRVDELPKYHPIRLIRLAWFALTYGVNQDVVSQRGNQIAKVHQKAVRYDNKTEHLFSFLQIMTAMIASLSHGANDVSNAIGPFVGMYQTWSSGSAAIKKTQVPVWPLAFGGACISVGLATYGFKVMRQLGNKITLFSPSRGFATELGAAITTLMAAKLGLPVSTTQCITGASLAVGLCNGSLRSVNWRKLGFIFLGWVFTVPMAGLIAGLLMAMALNAPHVQVD